MQELFGPYRLETLIGRSGTGEVFMAYDRFRSRTVAVERLSHELSVDPDFRARFHKECEIAAGLREIHVVPIQDYGEIDGRLYIDMLWVGGTNLSLLVRERGSLPVERAVAIVEQVAAALDAAHAENLVHRDVKSSNVLIAGADEVGERDFVYLVGFGVAPIRVTDGEPSPTAVETWGYRAPEWLSPSPIDHRADVYSLACVLYEALTGRTPFELLGDRSFLMHAYLRTPPPRPSIQRPWIPVALDRVVACGMAKDPARRYPTAGALAAAARAVLDGHTLDTAVDIDIGRWRRLGRDLDDDIQFTDEDIQFTVYRPARVRPARWYPLLAFVHKSTEFPGPEGGMVNPIALVEQQAQDLLRDQRGPFNKVSTDSSLELDRGSELLLEPWLDGGEMEPLRVWLRRTEPVHSVQFKLRAPASAEGGRLAGGMRVFLGVVLIAEVSFQVSVSATTPSNNDTVERLPVQRFRQIFASYSHQDADVVHAVAHYASLIGDQYVIDMQSLRSGEVWAPRLAELIEQSDIFQLFWSHNAMESPHVQREWEYALQLRREGFIRPAYWQEPRPADPVRGLPPEILGRLHWSKLAIHGAARQVTKKRLPNRTAEMRRIPPATMSPPKAQRRPTPSAAPRYEPLFHPPLASPPYRRVLWRYRRVRVALAVLVVIAVLAAIILILLR
ncbi:MAG: protein kinase domain-containing protein [Pseudonocardiaceae bacterium]